MSEGVKKGKGNGTWDTHEGPALCLDGLDNALALPPESISVPPPHGTQHLVSDVVVLDPVLVCVCVCV
jgi:hypothetical protein